VFNKADLLPPEEREKRAKALVRKLKWKAPWFVVSAIAREGTWPVCLKIQDFFDRLKAEAVEEMRSEDA
jgi:GTPase